ncbi:hypothetical protein B0A79_20815 [Flavobacterium piscis]|uniref:DUF4302 domain-containing protein n=1 Tax=Flavobacterium piscis TaxID=1114874 RepID=A0ABX2XRE1_9FLAO|nr:DUF4302 domain-containing protein [Flavobacterium piscis]OCB73794.1 hypothetical protein FLP_14060 [Flavobacterium piscis]OXE98615.1 hypothetical protein B0A79_20815 [Flavobacterium piscis]
MKAKYIYKCLMISFAALLLGSCSSPEVDAKFDQNATERLSGRQKELNDLLLSSAEGWKAVYYTDSTQLGGWTHLFKFLPGGKVDMASDFDSDTKTYTSQYDIQVGSTVSLVFTTENRIHLLSNAADYPTAGLLAKGYLGDFQFYYYGQKNGDIIFRTNRNGHFLRFVKATPQDWTDLPKNTPIISNITGDMTSPLFRLLEINDGTTTKSYDFDYNTDARFGTGYSLDPAVNTSYDLAFSFNPTGAYSKTPLDVKGQKLTDFLYNSTDNSFVATGKDGVKATIKYTNAPPIITDDYKLFLSGKGNPQMVLGYIAANLYTAPTTSDYFRFLINKVNATLPAAQSIARVQVVFNNVPNGTYIQYLFNGGKATIIHWLTSKEDAVNKTIVLVDDGWSVAPAAAAFLKDIDNELVNPKGLYVKKENFKISFTNTIYTLTSASSSFRTTTYQLN